MHYCKWFRLPQLINFSQLLGTARLACGLCICPSVCPRMGHSNKVCCRGLAGRRYLLQCAQQHGVRRANAGSATLSAYVVAEHRLVHFVATDSALNRPGRLYVLLPFLITIPFQPIISTSTGPIFASGVAGRAKRWAVPCICSKFYQRGMISGEKTTHLKSTRPM